MLEIQENITQSVIEEQQNIVNVEETKTTIEVTEDSSIVEIEINEPILVEVTEEVKTIVVVEEKTNVIEINTGYKGNNAKINGYNSIMIEAGENVLLEQINDILKIKVPNMAVIDESGYVNNAYNAEYAYGAGYSDYANTAYYDESGNSFIDKYARIDEYNYLPYNVYFADSSTYAYDSGSAGYAYNSTNTENDSNGNNIISTYVRKDQTINGISLTGPNTIIPTGGRKVATSINTTTNLTPTYATYDTYKITSLSSALTINNHTGNPTDSQTLLISIKDNGTSRALTFGTSYRAGIEIPMPTATTISKWMNLLFKWNDTDNYWDLVSLLNV